MNILITGGASGLGEAITFKFLGKPECNVFITYSKSADRARELEMLYSNVRAYQCDFTAQESVDSFCEKIKSFDIDVLVNNALTGILQKHFHKYESQYFVDSFRMNVAPSLQITQEVLKLCRKKKHGRIITVLTSYLMDLPPIGLSEYVASKNYLLSMSKSWTNENRKFNISSVCVSPSFMLTPLNADVDERIKEKMLEEASNKSFLKPEKVASVIYELAHGIEDINEDNVFIDPSS